MAEALLPLRARRPGVYTLLVAAGIGVFGALLQYGVNGTTGPMEPWRIGCLLAILGLWSWAALDGSVLAHHRRGKGPITYLAQTFAYGYFLAVSLVLMQLGEAPLTYAWPVYGSGGLLFGLLMGSVTKNRDISDAEFFFDDEHAMDRNILSRMLFFLWPVASVALITAMVSQPADSAMAPDRIVVFMVLFAAIWPLPYDIAKPFRRTFIGLMVLGLALLMLVVLVP